MEIDTRLQGINAQGEETYKNLKFAVGMGAHNTLTAMWVDFFPPLLIS